MGKIIRFKIFLFISAFFLGEAIFLPLFSNENLEIKIGNNGHISIIEGTKEKTNIYLEIYGKDYVLLGSQSPYAPFPVKINKREQIGKIIQIFGTLGKEGIFFDFFETVEKTEDGIKINYEVYPKGEGNFAIWAVAQIPKNVSIFNEKGIIGALPKDESENPTLASSSELIGWQCEDGTRIEFIPISGVQSLNIVDGRKWKVGFQVRIYSKQTGGHPSKKIVEGEPINLSFLIKMKK